MEICGQDSGLRAMGGWGAPGWREPRCPGKAQETTQLAWAWGLLGAGLEPGCFLRLCIV